MGPPSEKTKPVSAWQRRKLYSKQMLERRQSTKNRPAKTSAIKVVEVAKSAQKRKLSVVNTEEKENVLLPANEKSGDEIPVKRKRSGTFTLDEQDDAFVAESTLSEPSITNPKRVKRKSLSESSLEVIPAKKRKSSSQEVVTNQKQQLPLAKSISESQVKAPDGCELSPYNSESGPKPRAAQFIHSTSKKILSHPASSKDPNSKTSVTVSSKMSLRQRLSLWKEKKQMEGVAKKGQWLSSNRETIVAAPQRCHPAKGLISSNLISKDSCNVSGGFASGKAYVASKCLDPLPHARNLPSKGLSSSVRKLSRSSIAPKAKVNSWNLTYNAKSKCATSSITQDVHLKGSAMVGEVKNGRNQTASTSTSSISRGNCGKSGKDATLKTAAQKQSLKNAPLNLKQVEHKQLSRNLKFKYSRETCKTNQNVSQHKSVETRDVGKKQNGAVSPLRKSISSLYRSGKLAEAKPLAKIVAVNKPKQPTPVRQGVSSRSHVGNAVKQVFTAAAQKKAVSNKYPGTVSNNTKNRFPSIVEDVKTEKLKTVVPAVKTPHHKKSVSFQVSLEKKSAKKLPKTPIRSLPLREKLENWLDNKGYSLSSYRHLHCFGIQLSEVNKNKNATIPETPPEPSPNDSAESSPVLKTRRMYGARNSFNDILLPIEIDTNEVLRELKSLLKKGHPPNEVRSWLPEIVKNLPAAENNALYWECRALTAEMLGRRDEALSMFQMAVEKEAEPSEDLEVALSELLMRADTSETKENTPDFKSSAATNSSKKHFSKSTEKQIKFMTPRRPLVDKRNMFNSTKIKMLMTRNTPLFQRIVQTCAVDSPPIQAIVTPVRRSARLSVGHNTVLEDDMYINSLDELPEGLKRRIFFKPNTALKDLDLD